jgi:hypothetical protein
MLTTLKTIEVVLHETRKYGKFENSALKNKLKVMFQSEKFWTEVNTSVMIAKLAPFAIMV